MKNLHRINMFPPLLQTLEDQRIAANFFRDAYIPNSDDRRLKFKNNKVYYKPNGEWIEIQEWRSEPWRSLWQHKKIPFHKDMVIIE